MAALDEFQFEIDGYVFGHGRPIFVDPTGFDPGDSDWATQDQTNPITGARMMGRDVRTAGTWTWALHVNQTDPKSALDELALMGAKWANGAQGWRDSRAVAALRYRVGDRTRVIYGRPRRFSAKPSNTILGGHLAPVATFDRATSLHYDDSEQVADLQMAPSISGGFAFPAEFPLSLERDPAYVPPSAVVVGGDAPTMPVVTFTGPVTDPRVRIGEFVVGLVGSLPTASTVTIDARPWAQSITHSGATGNVSLSRETRLSKLALMPGAYDAVFTGTDTSGEAQCRIRWRNAWHTL